MIKLLPAFFIVLIKTPIIGLYSKRLLLAVSLLLIPPMVFGETLDQRLSDLIGKIENSHNSIKDLQAEFSQITRFSGFDTVVDSKGEFTFKKPGQLRWKYVTPNKNQVIVNQDRIWIFTPDLEQVIIRPFSDFSNSQIPVRFLIEIGHLDRDFKIDWFKPDKGKDPDKKLALLLRPKRSGGDIKKIIIEVDPKYFLITRINVFEAGGNSSDILFDEIKTNVGLEEKSFIFKPPAGTEIINLPSEG